MQAQDAQQLVDKIRRLPPERAAEVEDFIDFLSTRESDRELVKAAQAVSETRLKDIWDNDDDADYDRL